MRRTRKKGSYTLSEEVISKIKDLRVYEDSFRGKGFFTSKIDIVSRIFFDKDEYEWIKEEGSEECFVSSRYHRYYNLKSQRGIKAFNRLNEEEQNFYFERCKKTIEKVYESRNSYSFLNFYEGIENRFVLKEREKERAYYDKHIKPEFQKKINNLKEYERKTSRQMKRLYSTNCFPSIVNGFLFEVNQSKDEIRYNLYTKTGINRFRRIPDEKKDAYIKMIKDKIDNFYLSNKDYHVKKREELYSGSVEKG